MSATSESWKREPFKECVPIPYHAAFDAEQFSRLQSGLVPRSMEDKWFVYYGGRELFFHRSWTGQPVYRISLAPLEGGGAEVTEALWSKEVAVASKDGPDYAAQLLGFLVGNLVLGESRPFPLPSNLREPLPGVFQHHISGTGFPEVQHTSKKPWWRFW